MKVLVSLEESLVRKVDKAARSAGLTRSGWLDKLLRRELKDEKGPGEDPRVRRAIKEIQDLVARYKVPAADSTQIIREERDKRANRGR